MKRKDIFPSFDEFEKVDLRLLVSEYAQDIFGARFRNFLQQRQSVLSYLLSLKLSKIMYLMKFSFVPRDFLKEFLKEEHHNILINMMNIH